MIDLSSFHFLRPLWLVLLPIVGLLWWYGRNQNDPLRGWRSLIEPELLSALTVETSAKRPNRWGNMGLPIVWFLGVIAVAGPTWRPEPSPLEDDPLPVMIVLKASESMDLTDLMPSRMERARLKVADFANQRAAKPLGLITYAGSSHLVLPPTRDTAIVATMAAEVGPDIMPKPGDKLATALALAAKTLRASGGAIVVIADTVEDNDGAIDDFREESQLPIFVLAIARDNTPELDTLNVAAKSLGAKVTTMTPDSTDINQLMRQISRAPTVYTSVGGQTRWEEAGWWLVPFLAAIVLGMFRRETRLTTPQEHIS